MSNYRFFSRASDGSIVLISKRPAGTSAWQWAVYLKRNPLLPMKGFIARDERREGQWHDYYRLPFGWQLIVSHQDFHLTANGERH